MENLPRKERKLLDKLSKILRSSFGVVFSTNVISMMIFYCVITQNALLIQHYYFFVLAFIIIPPLLLSIANLTTMSASCSDGPYLLIEDIKAGIFVCCIAVQFLLCFAGMIVIYRMQTKTTKQIQIKRAIGALTTRFICYPIVETIRQATFFIISCHFSIFLCIFLSSLQHTHSLTLSACLSRSNILTYISSFPSLSSPILPILHLRSRVIYPIDTFTTRCISLEPVSNSENEDISILFWILSPTAGIFFYFIFIYLQPGYYRLLKQTLGLSIEEASAASSAASSTHPTPSPLFPPSLPLTRSSTLNSNNNEENMHETVSTSLPPFNEYEQEDDLPLAGISSFLGDRREDDLLYSVLERHSSNSRTNLSNSIISLQSVSNTYQVFNLNIQKLNNIN